MKIAVLYYSNGGETKRAVEAFAKGMRARGVCETLFRIEDFRFSFPWSVKQFLSVFPDCALGRTRPLAQLPVSLEKFDGVVLAGQPWFLSLSPPYLSLVEKTIASGSPKLPIFTLLTSRGMWIEAFHQLADNLREGNGNWIGHASYSNGETFVKSIIATVRFVLTGKKDLSRVGFRAGLQEQDLRTIEAQGEKCALEFLKQKRTSQSPVLLSTKLTQAPSDQKSFAHGFLYLSNQSVSETSEQVEEFAKWMYVLWAKILTRNREKPWIFWPLMTLFVAQLLTSIATIPLLRLSLRLHLFWLQAMSVRAPKHVKKFTPWRNQSANRVYPDNEFIPVLSEEMR